MHVALVDLFRCPEPHADSWLVLAADRTERRVVFEGVLGCPVCGAEYRIENGVTHFDDAGTPRMRAASPVLQDLSEEEAMRAAALLHATDANATLGFVGESVALIRAVQGIVAARCIAFDAPDADNAHRWHVASDAPLAVVIGSRQVLARGALSGLWLAADVTFHAEQLRPRGRLVASAARAVPGGFTELVRDESHWVAQRDAAGDDGTAASGGLTQLRRRR